MKKNLKNSAAPSIQGLKDVFQNFEEVCFEFPEPNEVDWAIQAAVAGALKGAWLIHLIQKFRGQCSPKAKVLVESMLSDRSMAGMKRILAFGAALQIRDWKKQGIIRPSMELPEPEFVIDKMLRSDTSDTGQALFSKVMGVYHNHFFWMCLDSRGADTLIENKDEDELADAIASFLFSKMEDQHG